MFVCVLRVLVEHVATVGGSMMVLSHCGCLLFCSQGRREMVEVGVRRKEHQKRLSLRQGGNGQPGLMAKWLLRLSVQASMQLLLTASHSQVARKGRVRWT